MKLRNVVLLALSTIILITLTYCGGGGSAMGIASIVPKGDYYMIQGHNPVQKFNAPIYKDIADEVKAWEDKVEEWEDEMDDMGLENTGANTLLVTFFSEKNDENLTYVAGPFKADDMEDYFEDEKNWEKFDEDDRNGRTYFTGEVYNSERGMILERGGLLFGSLDVVEDLIDVITKGKKKLVEDKKFNEFKNLTDFSATEYMYIWDNADFVANSLKGMIAQVDDDEDIADAADDLEAAGISMYWGGELRIVIKLKFKKDKNVDTLKEFFDDELDELWEKAGPSMMKGMFGPDTDTDDIEDLAEKTRVNAMGDILEIQISLRWDDIEDMVS